MRKTQCLDCLSGIKRLREYNYVINDDLWQKYVGHPRCGCMCIGCLERRMGRRLVQVDFKYHILNNYPKFLPEYRSSRLTERLLNGTHDYFIPMYEGQVMDESVINYLANEIRSRDDSDTRRR